MAGDFEVAMVIGSVSAEESALIVIGLHPLFSCLRYQFLVPFSWSNVEAPIRAAIVGVVRAEVINNSHCVF